MKIKLAKALWLFIKIANDKNRSKELNIICKAKLDKIIFVITYVIIHMIIYVEK